MRALGDNGFEAEALVSVRGDAADAAVTTTSELIIARRGLFDKLVELRRDSRELIGKMLSTVKKLCAGFGSGIQTSSDRPGMLLGKIQAGKTRAFIGIIAKAFDEGFDFAIVLTKGTQALAEQTLKRLRRDFAFAIDDDKVRVYDIMHLPKNLTRFHLKQKLIIVAKKEKNNLTRIFDALEKHYPDLKEKRLLIVDDEADYATLAFKKNSDGNGIEAGKIAQWIDRLRQTTAGVAFLQVTATPYSLYLQPNDREDSPLFHPVRPAFTELLPTYSGYIGGDFFFGEADNPESPAVFVFHEVSLAEREALKKQDRRSFKLQDALTSPRVAALRSALLNFIVGGVIRREQQQYAGVRREKYAFIVHTERGRGSHDWQETIVTAILDELRRVVSDDQSLLEGLVKASYEDLKRSLRLGADSIPSLTDIIARVKGALVDDEVMVSIVNSENQVKDKLDEDGQLRLDAPLNVFIGGQILDRGITIRNLIGFYYGRNPQMSQQDTVLQHARLYGDRSKDLLVTRFYTTAGIHQTMRRIHEFDSALREEVERGDQGQGIYFLRKDDAGRVLPCSPNKILASDIVTIRPRRRLQPIGFQTGFKSYIAKDIEELDRRIDALLDAHDPEKPVVIDAAEAAAILRLIETTLVFEDEDYKWDFEAHIATLDYLSKVGKKEEDPFWGKVSLFVRKGRDFKRVRESGRYSDEALSYQERPIVAQLAAHSPVLSLVRQEGSEANGWRGIPFWWPIITPPATIPTTIFASKTRGDV